MGLFVAKTKSSFRCKPTFEAQNHDCKDKKYVDRCSNTKVSLTQDFNPQGIPISYPAQPQFVTHIHPNLLIAAIHFSINITVMVQV